MGRASEALSRPYPRGASGCGIAALDSLLPPRSQDWVLKYPVMNENSLKRKQKPNKPTAKPFEGSWWQALGKILLGGRRDACVPWESRCQALPPRLVWHVPEALNWLLGNAAASRDKRPLQHRSDMGKHGLQERQKNAFCLSYSNRALNVVFPFCVLGKYVSKGSKRLWDILCPNWNTGDLYL